jgi:hypothetical protein
MLKNDILRLALAMGLGRIRPAYLNSDGEVLIDLANGTAKVFEPLLNVSDDYKVLNWMRDIRGVNSLEWPVFCQRLAHSKNYRAGDYARATKFNTGR